MKGHLHVWERIYSTGKYTIGIYKTFDHQCIEKTIEKAEKSISELTHVGQRIFLDL